ncbi:SDR family oxidoreductase [Fulvimarina endophytica]|uniref:SDR family oxidoreductase n=1 Tax=Fulvimarina endophytica TaxID=2293836 RepID=A0A371WZ16_9HYPH|nr:SDR family oxidoreductase [Fulvimarina endophytica]RFC62189.1 SDR family oxidoreductase [Fulvimarina endophytica]
MQLGLEGARVIVTAGAGGIGRAVLDAFLNEGAKVATCDIDEKALADLPPGVSAYKVDVADADALARFVDTAIENLGGLDCLVNNAGIAGPTSPIEEIGLADWDACLRIGLTSQYITAGRAVAALRRSSNASIVNISSLAGRMGFAYRTPYAAAKWGVIGLTKSLAIELGGDNIRVNAILPGLVAGDRQKAVLQAKAERQNRSFAEVEADAFSYTSIKDYVAPSLIADHVLFLAGRTGRLTSGETLSVCGNTRMLV